MDVHGRCLCGGVRYRATAPPHAVHFCHCSMCRQATGGPFAVLAWFDRGALSWLGTNPKVRRSSRIAERGFCAVCGTPLFLSYDHRADVAALVGTLERPEDFPPTYHYGVEARLAWADCGSSLPGRRTEQVL